MIPNPIQIVSIMKTIKLLFIYMHLFRDLKSIKRATAQIKYILYEKIIVAPLMHTAIINTIIIISIGLLSLFNCSFAIIFIATSCFIVIFVNCDDGIIKHP